MLLSQLPCGASAPFFATKERREAGWACGSSTVQPAVATDLARRAAQIAADAAAGASGKAPGRAELIHP